MKMFHRKRRGGIKLDEKNGDGPSSGITEAAKDENEEEANRRKELAEQIAIEEENKKKEKEKKRADELWSSFMSDVKRPVSGSSCSSSSLMPQVSGFFLAILIHVFLSRKSFFTVLHFVLCISFFLFTYCGAHRTDFFHDILFSLTLTTGCTM